MKSIEDIDRRLVEEKQKPYTVERDVYIGYLTLAKECPEHWTQHLYNKYAFGVKEDLARVEILKWILDKENEV